MTAANLVANGASLEDCHSNLFALTDLSGIKWRRYTATIPGPLIGPLEDPVLRSYANCLAGDILSVWRRIPDTNTETLPPGASNKPENSRTRELWVYWYGDEPDFSRVIADELKVNETLEGTWENGLTYECRTLLFKALHNLLERCLLSRNFTRLGKWFIRPYGADSEQDDQSEHVSFSFSFFLHGESTVCTSVEIQQHDPVRRLTVEHLSAAQGSATGFQVLLSPYGLSGVLTGQTYKPSDQNTQKLLHEWRQFFPIDVTAENSENEDGGAESADAHSPQLPPAVEVLVGGVRMCYPTSFVLVAHPEEVHPPPPPPPAQQGGMAQPATAAVQASQPPVTKNATMPSVMSLTPPTSPCDQVLPGETKITVMPTNSFQNQASIDYSIMGFDSSQLLQMSPKIAQKVVDSVWQDSLTNNAFNKPQSVEPTPPPPPLPPPPPPPQAPSSTSEEVPGGSGSSASTTSTTTTTTTTTSSTASASPNMAITGGFWDMTDPTVKANCTCSRQKAQQKRPFHHFGKPMSGSHMSGSSGLGSGSSSSSKHKMDSKQDKQLMRNVRPLTPFHHRSSLNDDLVTVEHDAANQRLGIHQPQLITSAHPDASAKKKIPPSSSSSASQQVKAAAGGGPDVGPTDSPHSAVPSPLYPPPNTNSNPERTMPTLSPYPPPRPGSESETSNSMASTGFNRQDSHLGQAAENLDSSQNESNGVLARTIDHLLSEKDTEDENSKQEDLLWQCYKLPQTEQVNLKRPLLPCHVYEDQSLDANLESLYSLSEENEFYQQPSKKLKPEYKMEPEEPVLSKMAISMPMENRAPQPPSPEPVDPYEFMEDPTTQTGPLFQRNRGKDGKKGRGILQRRNSIRKQDRKKQEEEQKKAEEEKVKQEQNQSKGGDQANEKNALVSGRSKSQQRSITGLPSARPDPSASLMRETDLVVTANDLDQLFESSDDDDTGLPFEDLTHKISQITDDGPLRPSNSSNKGSSLNSSTNGFLGASELARMFPTPPSLEQNPAFSPCNPGSAEYINPDSAPGATHLDGSSTVPDLTDIEIEESLGSPKPEPIKDWSFVYRVPTSQRFHGSTMYAPLKALPSSKLPPLKVPENCIYKPSWQVGVPQKQEFLHSGKDTNLPSVSSVDTDMVKFNQPITSLPSAGTPGVLQSPATFQGSQEHQSNFENSPASTPSSYVKNLNSMEPPTPANNIPEAHSLFVNLVLSDSLLNIFKDRNFDSCVICVCNMNIKGNDAGLYLQDNTNQPQYKCQCGFSAIMNRRYGTGSGLFAEDEQDITGQQHDIALWAQNTDHVSPPDPGRKGAGSADDAAGHSRTEGNRRVPDILVEIVEDQCASPYGTLCKLECVVSRQKAGNNSGLIARNQLELSDGCDACFHALEQGRQLMDGSNLNKLDDTLLKATCLQSWAFTTGAVDDRCQLSSTDCVRILTTLKPYLQEVIKRKRISRSWEPAQYIVQGPLTWHTLFRIASKSKAESPEPLPVPSFLVGNDKDWLSLSPYAMHYWDKLLLEPYCAAHDVAYVVVTPDSDFILQSTKVFFKELSAVYETCRLGRHVPYNPKVLRDGIMRIRKVSYKKVADVVVDDWFSQQGNVADAAKLKLYAQVCKHYLAPLLATQPVDRSMFDASRPERPSHMTSCPPPSSSSSSSHPSSSHGHGGDSNADAASGGSHPMSTSSSSSSAGHHSGSGSGHGDHDGPSESRDGCKRAVVDSDDDSKCPPFVVVYLVDPFSYGKDNEDGSQAMWTAGLLRCFAEMLPGLPDNLRKTISVQVVPLQQVLQFTRTEEGTRNLDQTKALAFSVFTQCRKYMVSTVSTKSLTGFGTAADLEKILKTKEAQELPFKLYTPPYILAPLKDKQTELTETFGDTVQQCGELFVGYCLSHDQRWLLATCTDQRGELMESCVINIDIPNSKRRKKVSVRQYAIRKLWDFIISVSTTAALPWRLIVGRLGRLGHGELKDWSLVLNRKNLLSRSKQMRDMCKTCNITGNTNDYPCILSACLVSMEPDPQVRIMADSVSTDRTGRSAFSQQNLTMLHSPGDATCTHIQVFPTSATTQVASSGLMSEPTDFNASGDVMPDELMFMSSDELNEDLTDTDLSHFLDILPASPSPNDPDPSQLGGGEGRPGSPNNANGMQSSGDGTAKGSETEEVFILQQPLALGFYVSTAATGPLPSWFWASSPQAEHSCPVFLKSALHVHTPSVHQSDDIMQQRHTHPLDSNFTTDVLRYVLENYNALSWLTADPSTKDRRSCLPVHFVVLMQLYNTVAALL